MILFMLFVFSAISTFYTLINSLSMGRS